MSSIVEQIRRRSLKYAILNLTNNIISIEIDLHRSQHHVRSIESPSLCSTPFFTIKQNTYKNRALNDYIINSISTN